MIRRWIVLLAITGCGNREPRPAPTVTGTVICEPHTYDVLGPHPAPNLDVAVGAKRREVLAALQRPVFVDRVAARLQLAPIVITRAVSIRQVKDSQLIEVGVALPDRPLATRICDAILARLRWEHPGVRIVDGCAPPGDR